MRIYVDEPNMCSLAAIFTEEVVIISRYCCSAEEIGLTKLKERCDILVANQPIWVDVHMS